MNSKVTGIIIFVILIAVGIGYKFYIVKSSTPGIVLKGYVGGEKIGFLQDNEVQEILRKQYNIELNYYKKGSIEMVQENLEPETDFLWPSSQVAMELYKINNPSSDVKTEIIFNSPIVIYTWDIVKDGLVKEGIVEKKKDAFFIVKTKLFLEKIYNQTKWKDLNVPQLYGKAAVISTDPTKSNSGNMFAGFFINILHGDVVNDNSVKQYLPMIKTYYDSLGFLQHSSGDLFEQYLSTGVGAKPMIAGYESQIIEFSLKNKEMWPSVKDKVIILYPQPTVWSSHPVIAITPKSHVLIRALQDRKIQEIAWKRYGFRTTLQDLNTDNNIFEITGIPKDIVYVMPMPTPSVMQKIIDALE